MTTADAQIAWNVYGGCTNHINGTQGNDDLNGTSQNDLITGNAGIDELSGGAGSDYLIPGEGKDYIYTGSGQDCIVFGVDSVYGDRIMDFQVGWDYVVLEFELGVTEADINIASLGSNRYELTLDGVANFSVQINCILGGTFTNSSIILG